MQRWIIGLAAGACLGLLGFACRGGTGEREIRRAEDALRAGEAARARGLLEQALGRRLGPAETARAWNHLGRARARLGETEAAIAAFEESHQGAPDWAAPAINLAAMHVSAGDPFRAGALLRGIALTDPGDTLALEMLAALQAAQGRWGEARQALREALERAPESVRLWTALGTVAYRAGDPDEAFWLWKRAVARNPGYAPALYNLGYVCAQQPDRLADAAAYYGRFLESDAPPSPRHRRAREALGSLERALALEQVARDPPPAPPAGPPPTEALTIERLLEQAAAAQREGEASRGLTLYLQAADRSRREGDTARAEQILRQAVREGVDVPRAHLALARFLLEQDRAAEALRLLEEATSLSPRSAWLYFALGEAAVLAAAYDTALIALRRAVELDPRHADALWDLASLLEQTLQRPEQALAAFELFKQRFPDDGRSAEARRRAGTLRAGLAVEDPPPAPVHPVAPPQPAPASEDLLRLAPPAPRRPDAAVMIYNRAVAYQNRGETEEAIELYRRALEQDDHLVEAYINLGLMYRMRGRLAEAGEAYERGLRLRPGDADAYFNLGLIRWEQGAFEAAREHALAALAANPSQAQAHYLLGLYYARDPAQRSRAAHHYREFLRLAPGDPAAPSVRRWLAQPASGERR